MKRREFLKALLGAATAAAVMPSALTGEVTLLEGRLWREDRDRTIRYWYNQRFQATTTTVDFERVLRRMEKRIIQTLDIPDYLRD